MLFKHLGFMVALAIIIGIEFAYRDPLFNRSITLQEELQAHITHSGINVFTGLSNWGAGPAYFAFFVWVYLQESRARAFYYVLFLTFTMFVMNITKMAYH